MIFIPALIAAAIYIAISVAFVRMAHARGRIPALIAGVIFAVIPTADYLVGTATLAYLCANARIGKIYSRVQIPPDYFSSDGIPDLVKISKGTDYQWYRSTRTRVAWPAIDEHTNKIINKKGLETLAENNAFSRKAGWAERFFDSRSEGCLEAGEEIGRAFYPDLSVNRSKSP